MIVEVAFKNEETVRFKNVTDKRFVDSCRILILETYDPNTSLRFDKIVNLD